MNDSKLNNINDIKRFLRSTQEIFFKRTSQNEAYQWMENTLVKFSYMSLSKSDKSTVKQYMSQITQYSRAQITRLISQYIHTGYVQEISYARNQFTKLYSDQDIKLLAQTDELHQGIDAQRNARNQEPVGLHPVGEVD